MNLVSPYYKDARINNIASEKQLDKHKRPHTVGKTRFKEDMIKLLGGGGNETK